MTGETSKKMLSANIHVEGVCNYHCSHCFATRLAKTRMTPEAWRPYLEYMKSIGITKVNLAGGEPFLYPHLEELCTLLKSM